MEWLKAHERLEMEMALELIDKNLDLTIKQCETFSKMMKEYYNALNDQGFTKHEALQIVIAHGINIGNMKR